MTQFFISLFLLLLLRFSSLHFFPPSHFEKDFRSFPYFPRISFVLLFSYFKHLLSFIHLHTYTFPPTHPRIHIYICLMSKFVCVECGYPTSFIFKDMNATKCENAKQAPNAPIKTDGIRLERCAHCGMNVDKYAEYDPIIIHLDTLLQRRQAYMHIIWNDVLQPESPKHFTASLLSLIFCILTSVLRVGALALGMTFFAVFVGVTKDFRKAFLMECLCFRIIIPMSFLNAIWTPCIPLAMFTLLVFIATNISCLITLNKSS